MTTEKALTVVSAMARRLYHSYGNFSPPAKTPEDVVQAFRKVDDLHLKLRCRRKERRSYHERTLLY